MAGRILVVEDDPDLIYLYKTSLGQLGYDVYQATLARDALFELSQRNFDAIILDLNLPDAYGTVVVDFIIHDPNHQVEQIIVITATDNWHSELNPRGVYNVMVKPISMNDVVDLIREISG